MTQKEAVIKHFEQFGSLSSWHAFQEYGITRLASIICDMRKEGYSITNNDHTVKNRLGGTSTYTEYIYHGKLGEE